MAEDTQQSGLETADEESDSSKIPNRPEPSGKFAPITGRLQVIRLGQPFLGGRVLIINVAVDGQPVGNASPRLTAGSSITINGRGLDNLDFWEVERSGRNGLDFRRRRETTPTRVVLSLADTIGGALDEGERFGLGFFSSKFGGKKLTLPLVFIFGDKEEENKDAQARKKVAEKAKSAEGDGLEFDPTEMILGATGDLLPKALLKEQNWKDLEKALKAGDKKAIKKAIDEANRLGNTEGLKKALELAKEKRNQEAIDAINEAIKEIGPEKSEPTESQAPAAIAPKTESQPSKVNVAGGRNASDDSYDDESGAAVSGGIAQVAGAGIASQAVAAGNIGVSGSSPQTVSGASTGSQTQTTTLTSGGFVQATGESNITSQTTGRAQTTATISGGGISATTQTPSSASQTISVEGKVSGGSAGSQTQTTSTSSGGSAQTTTESKITSQTGGGGQVSASIAGDSKISSTAQIPSSAGETVSVAGKVSAPASGGATAGIAGQASVRQSVQADVQAAGKEKVKTKISAEEKISAQASGASTSASAPGKTDAQTQGKANIQGPANAPAQSNISTKAPPASSAASSPIKTAASSPGKGQIDAANSKAVAEVGKPDEVLEKQPSGASGKSSEKPALQSAGNAIGAEVKPPPGVQAMLDRMKKGNQGVGEKLGSVRDNKDKAGQRAGGKEPALGLGRDGLAGGGAGLPPGGKAPETLPNQQKDEGAPQAGQAGGGSGSGLGGQPSPLPPKKEDQRPPGEPEAGKDAKKQPDKPTGDGAVDQPTGAPAPAGGEGGATPASLAEDAAKEAAGQVTSKAWWWGFGISSAVLFSGLDMMAGAAIMDVYWVFMHRKDPKLFPMKPWQKVVTVAANVVPLILIVFFIGMVMIVGCNWPIPSKYAKYVDYRVTVVGAFIGDDCKNFDISNLPKNFSSTAGSIGSSSSAPNASNQSNFTPRGPNGGGSNPDSLPILSFVKPWSGTDPYPAVDFGDADPNIDPAIKQNLNELKNNFNSLNQSWQRAGHGALEARQAYRPQAYQAHYRSVWEINAVINNKDNAVGYQCDQISHLDPVAVKQAYAQASGNDKQKLQKEFDDHGVTGPTPAGCVSDHASGIAMDITPPPGALYSQLISQAQSYGLCHNIAGDAPHFALTDKLPVGTNCLQP